MEITSRNTNTLSPIAYGLLQRQGILDQSRNGPVLRLREPLTIHLTHPRERVNFSPARDANPFFHLLEACAMLANENSVPFLSHLVKRMADFSDDGKTYNAFYGERLRSHFEMDQLNAVISNLLAKPHSRQEVALMWDPQDLVTETRDKACNLALLFSVDERNRLNMTSLNRSNDAILGMVNGANVVHLSIFHEYVACAIGRDVGSWFHFSNNFHVYTTDGEGNPNNQWERVRAVVDWPDYRELKLIPNVKLFLKPDQKAPFDEELGRTLATMVDCFDRNSGTGANLPDGIDADHYSFPFVRDAIWMFNVFQLHKSKKVPTETLVDLLNNVEAEDWRVAGRAWLNRRQLKPVERGTPFDENLHTKNVLST